MEPNPAHDAVSQADYVARSLENSIKARRFYATRDFVKLQIIAWSALLASFGSSILIAAPFPTTWWAYKLLLAFLAAVPALLVALESGINYANRSRMNEEAYLTFEHLLFRLKNGEDAKPVFDEFIAYSKQLARDFPRGTVLPTIKTPPKE